MRILYIVILAVLLITTASAATFEENYDTEFTKLKDTRNYLYRSGDTIQWQIIDFNPDFEYYIRIYSYRHTTILKEWKVDKDSGKIQFIYPGLSKIHINLQRWIPEGKEDELCKEYKYTSSYGQSDCCDIGKNLDIITISPITKIEKTDLYIMTIREHTKPPSDEIQGASWQSLINVDKGGIK